MLSYIGKNMIQLRCTKKVLEYLGIKKDQLCDFQDSDTLLGNWYLNMINIERRKILIFMNENTLLSFLVYGMKKDKIDKLPEIFLGGLDQVLRYEGIKDRKIDYVLNQNILIEITKTNSRSLLGNLNDLIYLYISMIDAQGGIQYCDMTKIIKQINRTPQRNLNWGRSINKVNELFETV